MITIPLTPEDSEIDLDLQTVFSTAFNQAGYDAIVDYRSEPAPPLKSEQAKWADELLKKKGLR